MHVMVHRVNRNQASAASPSALLPGRRIQAQTTRSGCEGDDRESLLQPRMKLSMTSSSNQEDRCETERLCPVSDWIISQAVRVGLRACCAT